ncbi:TetR/AcrR family transcriptional regulator [Pseudaquabacterium rugosum]|uniref:TetR/AcrR family transcriptional regulator n=1 Tax=Pseudaquabacterium rugosum TaxID=2984194 RepID=A0ABU9B7W9_9BURK
MPGKDRRPPTIPADAPVGTAGAARPARRTLAGPRAEQRRRDLLRIARAVFAERGYEHTTTAEIAQRLGSSEATVFTYFPGKRALCLQVIADWYAEVTTAMDAALQAALAEGRPLRAQFDALVRTHLRLFLAQEPGMCALVLSEGRAKDHVLAAALPPLQRRYTAPLMDVLARGQTSGELRTDLPLRLLRNLVLGPIEHLLWDAVAAGRPVDPQEIGPPLVEALWGLVRAPEAELAALRRLREELVASLARVGHGTVDPEP